MKLVLTILLVLSIGVSCAVTDYACMFLAINPSNISRALGYGNIGVVDVWHNNPLTSYSNPAIASLHEGISYGYTHENWLEDIGIADMQYDCGLINIGYKGVGIILPAPNKGSNYGINLDYSSYPYIKKQSNTFREFKSMESATVYGLSINTSEFLKRTEEHHPLFDVLDLAFGAERVLIKSDFELGQGYPEELSKDTAEAACLNLGLISRFKYFPDENIKLEGVYGLSIFNAFNEKIKYLDDDWKDTIYRFTNNGLALSASVLSENLLKGKVHKDLIFFDNILSTRLFVSLEDDYTYREDKLSYGVEIGFLDTFFIRRGHYRDRDGSVVGDTEGYGISLHYKNLFEYSYNSSSIPTGLSNNEKSSDQTFMINLVELYNLTLADK